jgi:predicted ATP-binding protein involved in virulence
MTNDMPPTRLDLIRLVNFRCFHDLKLEFDPNLTVIIAPNGGGKTAILDAIAIAWRLFVDTLQTKRYSIGFDHSDILLKKSENNTMEPMLPIMLFASGCISGIGRSWGRLLESDRPKAKTTFTNALPLKEAALDLRSRYQEYLDKKRLAALFFRSLAIMAPDGFLAPINSLKARNSEGLALHPE